MRSQTITITIAAPPALVYEYASNPINLTTWVPSFCHNIRYVDNAWTVESPMGEVVFEFVGRNQYGVLDHIVTLASGVEIYNPMRVVPNGLDSEVLFTLFQHEGMSDEQFEEDAELIRSDLEMLKHTLEGMW